MKANLLKPLIGLCLISIQLTSFSAMAKGGSMVGGGGDSSELRVNEIRSDILSWVKKGGAKGLALPRDLSLAEYESKMVGILQPQEVVVSFIEKDDEKNDELKVSVNGTPKTCRGFISSIDSKSHILCNVSRFKNTSESEQYKLIHHEFAGLVNVENNEGAASDYVLSTQITDFLTQQTVLRLAVKAPVKMAFARESCNFALGNHVSNVISEELLFKQNLDIQIIDKDKLTVNGYYIDVTMDDSKSTFKRKDGGYKQIWLFGKLVGSTDMGPSVDSGSNYYYINVRQKQNDGSSKLIYSEGYEGKYRFSNTLGNNVEEIRWDDKIQQRALTAMKSVCK